MALGSQRAVEHAGDADVGERTLGGAARDRLLERLFHMVERGCEDDGAAVDIRGRLGVAREAGQAVEGQVHLDRARSRPPTLDGGHEIVRQFVPVELLQEGDLRVGGGDDDGRVQLVARFERDAGHPAVVDHDAVHRGPGVHLGSEARRGRLQRARHRAHAALREPPCPDPAAFADVADLVVHHHVSRAGRPRARPGADDTADREHTLELRTLEVIVEEVGDARGEEPGQVARRADVDAAEAPTEAGQVEQIARPLGADLGRDLRQHRAEQVGQAAQPGVPLLHGVGVAGGELRDLLVASHRIVGELQVAAVRVGREVGPLRVDPVAVPFQLELSEDGRRHQAHDVREGRHLVVRTPWGLRDRGPADRLPALHHDDPLPGLGQEPRRHESVVAAADDDDVVAVG